MSDVSASSINPWHIYATFCKPIGPNGITRKLIMLMPTIPVPTEITPGGTGYPHIKASMEPTYGHYLDEFGRIHIIVGNYLLFQRYPNCALFMGGEIKPHNSINNEVSNEEIEELIKVAKAHMESVKDFAGFKEFPYPQSLAKKEEPSESNQSSSVFSGCNLL